MGLQPGEFPARRQHRTTLQLGAPQNGLFGADGDATTNQLPGHSCNPEDFRPPPAPPVGQSQM
eukprot:2174278-Pyramimonas_sp.AAC.1